MNFGVCVCVCVCVCVRVRAHVCVELIIVPSKSAKAFQFLSV